MLIRKLDLATFDDYGDYSFKAVFPWEGATPTPFGSGYTHLAPGQVTKKHQHHEIETYFVAYGKGQMEVDDEMVDVGPGDVIHLPPFHRHVLRNNSEDDLLFLSIYWEDMSVLDKSKEEALVATEPLEAAQDDAPPVTRIAAVVEPTLGGLAGPALAADTHLRFLSQCGGAAELELLAAPGAAALLSAVGIEASELSAARREAKANDLFERLQAADVLDARDGDVVLPLSEDLHESLRRYLLEIFLGPAARATIERWLAEAPEAIPVRVGDAFDAEFAAAAVLAAPSGGAEICALTTDDAVRCALLAPLLQLALGVSPPAAYLTSEGFAAAPPRQAFAELAPDTLRFVLARLRPEAESELLDADELASITEVVAEGELAGWGDWLAELSVRLAEEYGGTVPATGLWTEEQRHFYEELKRLTAEAERAYSATTFSLQDASRVLERLVFTAQRFARRELAWIGVPGRSDERRTSVALELTAAKVLAMLAAPLLPDFAGQLWRRLGEDGTPGWESVPEWISAGRQLGSLVSEPIHA